MAPFENVWDDWFANSIDYIALNGKMINELKMVLKEAVMVCSR
jgi:hypothetical protein